MTSKVRDESYSPSEADCLEAIKENLNNYYVIAARGGDITITHRMKKEAFESFQKVKKGRLITSLHAMPDEWFIRTQLQGWAPILKRFTYPFGSLIHGARDRKTSSNSYVVS